VQMIFTGWQVQDSTRLRVEPFQRLLDATSETIVSRAFYVTVPSRLCRGKLIYLDSNVSPREDPVFMLQHSLQWWTGIVYLGQTFVFLI
jgi:hypothetical protein